MIIVPSPCRPKLNLARSSSSRRLVAIVMIEVVNGTITIPNWEKHQSVDKLAELKEYNRLAQQKSRAKKRALQAVNDMSMTCQRSQGIEEDIDKDIEEDIKEIDKEKPTRHKYGEYQNVLLTDLHNRNLAQKTSFAVCQ